MNVRCLDCQRFSFERAGEEWARKGVGCCEDRIAAMKFDPMLERDCLKFEPAEARVTAKRAEWMRKVKAEIDSQEAARKRAFGRFA